MRERSELAAWMELRPSLVSETWRGPLCPYSIPILVGDVPLKRTLLCRSNRGLWKVVPEVWGFTLRRKVSIELKRPVRIPSQLIVSNLSMVLWLNCGLYESL